MPELLFGLFSSVSFCSRRNRNRDIAVQTVGSTAIVLRDSAEGVAAIAGSTAVTDIEPTQLSRAKSRWLQATLAIVLRNRLARAWVELGRRARHNKRIGIADPDVSRRWGQLGVWLRHHQL